MSLTAKERGHVRMLIRRRDRLRLLVADWKGNPGGDSWARAEVAAIEWSLGIISQHFDVDLDTEPLP